MSIPEDIIKQIAEAGYDRTTVIADSVTVMQDMGSFESLHAHGRWQPGTVYFPKTPELHFDTVETQNGQPRILHHEIPYSRANQ